jgi:hypothetical protein
MLLLLWVGRCVRRRAKLRRAGRRKRNARAPTSVGGRVPTTNNSRHGPHEPDGCTARSATERPPPPAGPAGSIKPPRDTEVPQLDVACRWAALLGGSNRLAPGANPSASDARTHARNADADVTSSWRPHPVDYQGQEPLAGRRRRAAVPDHRRT